MDGGSQGKVLKLGRFLVDFEFNPDGEISILFHGDYLERVVLSFHDHSEIPADHEKIARAMDSSGAGMLKIAVICGDTSDLLRLLNLRAVLSKPAVLIGMRVHGRLSRFLYKKFGSPFTFAVEDEKAFSGAGLPTLKELRDFGLESAAEPKPLEVLGGSHIVNSSGIKVYNSLFREKGMEFIYLPIPTKNLDETLELAEKLGFLGLSVTMPHKETALKKCAETNLQAEKIGAVNTLVLKENGWYGTNTDAEEDGG